MRKALIVTLIIVIAVGGLFAAMKKHAPKKQPATTQQIQAKDGIPVETAGIARGDMEQTVEVTGDINALDRVTLSSKIPGRVAQVMAREGDRVSRGQTVVVLDQQDLLSNLQTAQGGLETALARLSQAKTSQTVTKIQTDAAIEQAQAMLDSTNAGLAVAKNPSRSQDKIIAENGVAEAKANLDRAESDYNRNKSLVTQGAISQSTFDVFAMTYKVAQTQYKSATERLSLINEGGRVELVRQSEATVASAKEGLRTAKANASQNLLRKEDVRQAQAALAQAKAMVAISQQQLSYSNIKSPISGVLSSRTTEPGQVVSVGQALAEVVNLGSIYFKGDVSEKAFAGVRTGQPVRVRIDAIPGEVFQGVLAEIYPSGSIVSRNFPVRIAIKQSSGGVRPGMFARGEIITGTARNVLLVPKDAIDERKGTQSVFTVGAKRTVARHIVEVIRENRDYVQIQTPTDLKVGDVVVTQGRQNLQQGTKVLLSNGK
jgi:RND family efflux transporter MFP subunit